MDHAVRSVIAAAAMVAHLLLSGVGVSHCHAAHAPAVEHRVGEHHVPAFGPTHHSHAHHHHHDSASRGGDSTPEASACLAGEQQTWDDHGHLRLEPHLSPLALAVRVERGREAAGDAWQMLLLPRATTVWRQALCVPREGSGWLVETARRPPSLHDLLPHVLRL